MKYKTEDLIDVTNMKRILSELKLREKIKAIWDVKENNLAFIADLMLEDATPEQINEFIQLAENDKIRCISDPNSTVIPETNAVHCIRLEPFYVVKDLKKVFC